MDSFVFDTSKLNGWVKDPVAVAESIQSRSESGEKVMCSDWATANNPQLKGYWQYLKREKGVVSLLLSDATKKLRGSYLRPFLQLQGTCVDRGTTGSVQIALDNAIVNRTSVARPIIIQFGTTYIGARGDIGGNRLRGQGAILAEAMECISKIGVLERKTVGRYDFINMTEADIEAMVVNMSFSKLPAELKEAMKGHVCDTFWCDDLSLVFDCVASQNPCPYACDYVTGHPNASGRSNLGDYGPHCRLFSGVYVDENGEDQLVSKESWGAFPAGQTSQADFTRDPSKFPCITVKTAAGPLVLPPGEVGVNARQFAESIYNGGEVWAVGAPTGFEPDRLSDLLD